MLCILMKCHAERGIPASGYLIEEDAGVVLKVVFKKLFLQADLHHRKFLLYFGRD